MALAQNIFTASIALAEASSAIATTLLTVHSAFALPLDLQDRDEPVCAIGRDVEKGELLKGVREADCLVWVDYMSHRNAFEAVDRTLRDVRGRSELIGGVTVILLSNFRQTLPVIPRGSPADEIFASIKSSHLWQTVYKCDLITNMRA